MLDITQLFRKRRTPESGVLPSVKATMREVLVKMQFHQPWKPVHCSLGLPDRVPDRKPHAPETEASTR